MNKGKLKNSIIIKVLIIINLILTLSSQPMIAQETIRIVAYNLLAYANTSSGGDTTSRNDDFRTIMNALNPDILVACELKSQVYADSFLTKVMNSFSSSSVYEMGTFVVNSHSSSDNNVIYYKPSKFTFLSSSQVEPTTYGNHPTFEYQLYNNLTGDKIVIYGVHFTSGVGQTGQRNTDATAIRTLTDAFPSGSYFIAAGDFNFFNGGTETAFSTLLDQTNSGYFLDPLNLPTGNSWTSSTYYPYHTLSSRKSSFGGSNENYGLKYRSDLILNSQSVVDAGGVTYNSGSYVTYGNDGNHHLKSINASPTNTAVGQTMADSLYYASDHIPVYADYTFDFPTSKNPPYPGSIVFTQVGATDPDVIEFMTLYRMDLTTLKITDNSVNADSSLGTGEGEFDLSNTSWTDVPAGTFVRLGTDLTNDDDAADRILQYKGSTEPVKPSLTPGGEQLIAYTGSSSNPTYIAGINWGNSGWTGATSYAPGTPSDISLGTSDNYYFSGTVDDILNVTRDTLTNQLSWSSFAGGSYNNLTGTIGNSALPVELIIFTANLNGNSVELRWRTETEVNNYGFEIERTSPLSHPYQGGDGEAGGGWETIGFVEGHGNSNSPRQYDFIDNQINLSGTYSYRLKQIDNDGTFEYSEVISVAVEVPNKFYLSQNYPNPFNPTTRIDFAIPQRQNVSLGIYNMLGEKVIELINEQKGAGNYSVTFDLSNLPSGVYVYRLQTEHYSQIRKMVLLK